MKNRLTYLHCIAFTLFSLIFLHSCSATSANETEIETTTLQDQIEGFWLGQ